MENDNQKLLNAERTIADEEGIDDTILDLDLPDEKEFTQFMSYYRQVMVLYESAIQYLTMRLDLIKKNVKLKESVHQSGPFQVVSKTFAVLHGNLRQGNYR